MATKSKQQKVIEQFYKLLDDNIEESLSYEQRTAVEDAITMLSVASTHKVDIRKSFPFWGKRYYFAFLLGMIYVNQAAMNHRYGLCLFPF